MEIISSRPVYRNAWLSLREDTVRRPDGTTGPYAVLESADVALVLPADGDRLCLVEQHRHPVEGRRWELPSGSNERHDADPGALAARELREETGLLAGTMTALGTLEISPSTFDQRCHVFLATDLVQAAPEREAAELDMTAAWFSRADVERMIRDGAVTDAKTVAAYALLLLHERTATT